MVNTLLKQIEELEKENASLKDALEGYKQNAKWCDKCDKLSELKKENAELKETVLQFQKDSYCGVCHFKTKAQLKQAKDLLAKWVELFKPKGGNIPPTPIQVDTEQFLKENSTYERIQRAKYNYTD